MEKTIIPFEEFVDGYKAGKFSMRVNPAAISSLVRSPQMNKSRRLAYKLYLYIAIGLFCSSAYLIFLHWFYAVIAIFAGMIILSANKKSAIDFITERVIENEEFFHFCFSNTLVIAAKDGYALIYNHGEFWDL